jgi:NAD+ synthase
MGIAEETDVAVIGMSGGADSTLVACLCVKALGKDNVYGVHMPYNNTDSETFNSRSMKLADKLGIHSIISPITSIADSIVSATECAVGGISVTNKGNARSRARMTVLYGIAHQLGDTLKCRARVVGTGNLSEDSIGYDTKGGDALADFFPIGNLFKSQVYAMLEKFKIDGIIDEEHIDRVPSAGLWEGQTDEGELGYSYNQMEPIVKAMFSNYTEDSNQLTETLISQGYPADITIFVINRHFANRHKHMAPKVLNITDL